MTITLEEWKNIDRTNNPSKHALRDMHGRVWDIISVHGGTYNKIRVQCPGFLPEYLGMYPLNKGDDPKIHDEELGQLIELNHPDAVILEKE